jgi:hypothetical protein
MIALQPYFSFSPALQTIEFLISFKLLMIVGDVLCAFLVRWIVFGLTEDRKSPNLAFALVFLSPIIFIESGVHGMFDIYCGLLSLLSVYFVVKRKYFFAGMSWSAATLIKIFPAYLFPVLVAMIFRQHKGDIKAITTNLIQAIAGFAIVFFMLYYPQLMDGTFMDTWQFLIGRVGNVESLTDKSTKYAWVLIPALVLLVLGGRDLRQEHILISHQGCDDRTEDPLFLQGCHRLQHPGRPAGGMLRVRLQDAQRHLVRQVPGPVNDIHPLGSRIVQVQRQVMLNPRHPGKMPGIGFPGHRTGNVSGRNTHAITPLIVLTRYLSAAS